MKFHWAVFCCLFLSLFINLILAKDDSFSEELFFKELPDGKVYGHFQFTTHWNISINSDESFRHFRVFPKSLGEVLRRFSVHELHLSMTQGLWRHEKWGYPITSAPPGAELWVWFADKKIDIDKNWMDLINVLSGMFCASLNFMDLKSTITPKFSFRPSGVTTENYEKWYTKHVRYAALPRELVCTENLTPWKKLLPCSSKSGIAMLLNAMKLYNSHYHSLAVHYRPICLDDSCLSVGAELSQTLSLVLDPLLHSSSQGNKFDWSLRKLFGRMISANCPASDVASVYFDAELNPTAKLSLTPSLQTPRYYVYNLKELVQENKVFNMEIKHERDFKPKGTLTFPVLTVTQFQTGTGQATGGIMCLLRNAHESRDITVAYQIVIPWFIRTYLHTLKLETFAGFEVKDKNGKKLEPLKVHFVPGKDRQRAYHLEVVFNLPAQSITRLSFSFEKALLRWVEYPPDANHGFYIGSASVTALLPDTRNCTGSMDQRKANLHLLLNPPSNDDKGYFIRLYTESLLVSLPTPDFSMPYNVICLACTVMAIAFGSIHNLTTRQFVLLDPSKRKGLVTRAKDLIAKAKDRFLKKGKSSSQPSSDKSETENKSESQNEEEIAHQSGDAKLTDKKHN